MRNPGPNLRRWLRRGSASSAGCSSSSSGSCSLALGVAHLIRGDPRPSSPTARPGRHRRRHPPVPAISAPRAPFGGVGSCSSPSGRCRAARALTDPFRPAEGGPLVEVIYQKRFLARGPRIVAIGGGTGLSALLRGLKEHTSNLTAVVTVADDGGSSGALREELGIPPVGDIRNCIAALADAEPLMSELLQYRFPRPRPGSRRPRPAARSADTRSATC